MRAAQGARIHGPEHGLPLTAHGARALIVGLDGATLDVIEPLVRDGRLPILGRLLREGTSARMRSTIPPMTLPAWSSFLTGSNPGRHGIIDFVRRIPGTYDLEFANSTHRRVPTMHRLLSDRGARVASIAVPTTYPPEKVNGVVISGFDSPVALGADASFVHPRSEWAELVARFGGMAFADFQELDIGPGWHDHALRSLLAEIPRKEGIGRWLLSRERWDLFMVMFGETDTASHHFWRFADPGSPRRPDDVPAHLADAIGAVYTRCDAALGRLIDEAQPEIVVIASDHGFGGSGDEAIYLNRFLEEHGWLRYRGGGRPVSGLRAGTGLVDRAKAAALRLPGRAQERIVRAMPSAWLGAVESRSRYGDLDFRQTRAWSDEMNYAATVHLNVAGRDPHGTIGDRDAAIRQLSGELLAWRIDERPVVDAVHTREELYDGPCVAYAPDLVLDLAIPDGYTRTVLPSARIAAGVTSRKLGADELAGAKGSGMNGSHRREGTLILWGKGIAADRRVDADIIDPLPTLFAALGEAIPDHVDGRVLRDAFAGAVRATWTAGTIEAEGGSAERALGAGEAEAVRRRLAALGYL